MDLNIDDQVGQTNCYRTKVMHISTSSGNAFDDDLFYTNKHYQKKRIRPVMVLRPQTTEVKNSLKVCQFFEFQAARGTPKNGILVSVKRLQPHQASKALINMINCPT